MKLFRRAAEFQSSVRRSGFFRQAVSTYGTQLLMAVLSLVASVIIARALGPGGRGDYAVAMTMGIIGVQLGNLGLQSTNSYFVAKDRALLPTLLANSLSISFLLGGAAAVVLGAVFHFWAKAPVHGRLLWLTLVWIPFGLAYLLVVNLLMGLQEVRLYNTIELTNKVLATVFIVAAVWLGARTPEIIFLLVLLGLTISFFIALRKLKGLSHVRARPSMDLFRKNFELGWKAYLCCFFSFLVIRIDLLMVKSMLGAPAAGYYSIAVTLADCVLLLPVAVGAVLFPKLSALSDDAQKRALTRNVVAGTAVGLFALLLVLGLSAKFVVLMLFGRAFSPATAAFLFLAPGILFLGLETVVAQYLNSCGFPMTIVVVWVSCTILNVALNFWAIPAYGINGASVISSISYLFALLGISWAIYTRQRSLAPAEREVATVTN
jgi:O-antigen/teichoic acid export membrane protein